MSKLLKRKFLIPLFSILLTASSLSCAHAAASTAEEAYSIGSVCIGGGGMITGFAVHPSNPDLVYCRTDVGGVFRWEPDEQKWTALNDTFGPEMSNYYGIDSIALDPNDEDVIYIACGGGWWSGGCVMKSTDRGKNWEKTGLSVKFNAGGSIERFAGECIAVDPNNSNVVWCGTRYDGLWKSTDAGRTWENIAEIPKGHKITEQNRYDEGIHAGIRSVVFDENGNLYAGVKDYGVYMYDGIKWTLLPGSPTCVMILKSDGGRLYASNHASDSWSVTSQLYEYSGGVWKDITPPAQMASYISYVFDITSDSNGNSFVFVGGDEALYCRDALGVWSVCASKEQGRVDLWKYQPWSVSSPARIGKVTALAFSEYSDGGRTCWLGNGMRVLKNDSPFDANSTFHAEIKGIEELCVISMSSPPQGESHMYCGVLDYTGFLINKPYEYNAQRISMLNNADGTLESAQQICDIDFCESDPKYMAYIKDEKISGAKGVVGTSEDGGKTWYNYGFVPTEGLLAGNVAVSAQKNSNGYPTIIAILKPNGASGNTAVRSEDFGRTWSAVSGLPEKLLTGTFHFERTILAADRVDGNKFYVFDYKNGNIYTSSDNGVSFVKSPLQLSKQAESETKMRIEAAPGKKDEVWFSAPTVGLYKSTDGGKTAERIANAENVRALSFGAPAPGSSEPSAYIVGSVGGVYGIYRSDDGGASWIRLVGADFALGIVTCIQGDRQEYGTVYIGTGGRGIFVAELPKCRAEIVNKDGAFASDRITVRFSEPMSDSVLSAGAVVSDAEGNRLETENMTLSENGTLLALKLNGALSTNTEYTLTFNGDISSKAGKPLNRVCKSLDFVTCSNTLMKYEKPLCDYMRLWQNSGFAQLSTGSHRIVSSQGYWGGFKNIEDVDYGGCAHANKYTLTSSFVCEDESTEHPYIILSANGRNINSLQYGFYCYGNSIKSCSHYTKPTNGTFIMPDMYVSDDMVNWSKVGNTDNTDTFFTSVKINDTEPDYCDRQNLIRSRVNVYNVNKKHIKLVWPSGSSGHIGFLKMTYTPHKKNMLTDNVCIDDSDGCIIYSADVTAGENLTSLTSIMGVYKNQTLISAVIDENSFEYGETKRISMTYSKEKLLNADKLKIFWWNNTELIEPFKEADDYLLN